MIIIPRLPHLHSRSLYMQLLHKLFLGCVTLTMLASMVLCDCKLCGNENNAVTIVPYVQTGVTSSQLLNTSMANKFPKFVSPGRISLDVIHEEFKLLATSTCNLAKCSNSS